ncbi:sensor histidine kinase [Marinomonas algicola]|uniref:7TMR-DISM family protein n=1 Tax=Marinomonas algicola TaxID=2773454 RepID=UPI00174A72AA|nr:sensor histidine kinase [Marinomonas algicola]
MKFIILTITLLFSIDSFCVQNMAIIDDEQSLVNLGNVASIYQDINNQPTERIINKHSDRLFTYVNKPFIHITQTNGSIWVRSEVSIQKTTNSATYLYIKAPQVNALEVFLPQTLKDQAAYSMETNTIFHERKTQHLDHIVPLPETLHNSLVIYLKVSSSLPVNIQLFALDNTELIKMTLNNLLLSSLFISISFIFLLGGLLLFIQTKHSMYAFYCGILISILMLHLSFHGFFRYFFSIEATNLQSFFYAFILLYLSTLTFFSRCYLDTQLYYPKINRYLAFFGWGNFILSITLFFFPSIVSTSFLLADSLITNTALLGIALYAYGKKTTHSGHYILSRGIVLIGMYLWILSLYGIYPSPIFYQWGLTSLVLIESSIYFIGMMKRIAPFRFSNKNQIAPTTQDTNLSPLLADTGERMRRQINIIDTYVSYWQARPLEEHEKSLTSYAYTAANNLKLLSTNLTLLEKADSKHEQPELIEKIIQNAIDTFNNTDQDNSDLTILTSDTNGVELLSHIKLLKQLLINLIHECKHLNGELLTINLAHTLHKKLGIKTIDIVCHPISNKIKNEFRDNNLGIRLIKDIVDRLNGRLKIENDSLTIHFPANSRQQVITFDTFKADPAQILVIGDQSVLVERVLRTLQNWPNNVIQIKSINELLTDVKTQTTKNTVNLILMFENEGYIPNLALKQIRMKLHAGDQCILITENVKMSRNYALTLGFDDLFSDQNIEQHIKESLNRFTSKGLRIKNASHIS